ncbi:MAG: nitronate monooxygenase [Bacteroidetes bacterium]|nr:nitronate monooxygenase [Bacteroidota bacterium]
MQSGRAAHPRIIQGGMGVAVSGWKLAKEVASAGELGVVSGTGLSQVFAQRLQDGDADRALRRALDHFPDRNVASTILAAHFNKPRTSGRRAVRGVPMYTLSPSDDLLRLTVVATFCEVWLAKEGHDGLVGINLLEKVQLPNLASIYGAMLAGVDFVLMGAGIPREIPGALDNFALHHAASIKVSVDGATADDNVQITLDPRRLFTIAFEPLKRPKFLAIVSSDVLAEALLKRANGTIDGFVIENERAGGHNAPPRGALRLTEFGEPIYGPRDAVNLDTLRSLGLPFWLAGDQASPEHLSAAVAAGAQGIQVGTAFAFCAESGLAPHLREGILRDVANGRAELFTDPNASPAGFPFKVVRFGGTISDPDMYAMRPRLCQYGLLRQAYKRPDGSIGYRCPAEPVESYVQKGGNIEDTIGKKCLCNALMANIDLPQEQLSGYIEKPLVTAGDSIRRLGRFLHNGSLHYSARDVLEYLCGVCTPTPAVIASGS